MSVDGIPTLVGLATSMPAKALSVCGEYSLLVVPAYLLVLVLPAWETTVAHGASTPSTRRDTQTPGPFPRFLSDLQGHYRARAPGHAHTRSHFNSFLNGGCDGLLICNCWHALISALISKCSSIVVYSSSIIKGKAGLIDFQSARLGQ